MKRAGQLTSSLQYAHDGRLGLACIIVPALYPTTVRHRKRHYHHTPVETSSLHLVQRPPCRTARLRSLALHLHRPPRHADASGAVVWRAEYEPYGNIYQQRAGSAPPTNPAPPRPRGRFMTRTTTSLDGTGRGGAG